MAVVPTLHNIPHISYSAVSPASPQHGIATPSSVGLSGSSAPSVFLLQMVFSPRRFSSTSSLVVSTSGFASAACAVSLESAASSITVLLSRISSFPYPGETEMQLYSFAAAYIARPFPVLPQGTRLGFVVQKPAACGSSKMQLTRFCSGLPPVRTMLSVLAHTSTLRTSFSSPWVRLLT